MSTGDAACTMGRVRVATARVRG